MSDAAPDTRGADRIAAVTLDERLVIRRSREIEHERAVAIYDLIEENRFRLVEGPGGPYALHLAIEDNSRLVLDVRDGDATNSLRRIGVALQPFRRIVKDYFTICESYFDAIKRLSPSQIEAIDMGRRGIHNEGSEMLRDRLSAQVEVDLDTARRLFTLLCVLHIRA